ncbi:Appr-1-p processing protein [Acinetobacter phage vB_AbaM_ME3]|uniref:Appr-1-p processing protein n=1 Tax=Acinetobacter phage vB_AbaM_ME3 TaxID=1837876 RepID=A0A172Q0U4_9CAUD|nr:Appr-1-p processing protein [Acinetobacter phage vB_AbaM_ME3]AND75457.1 Appr-1-p processing protein [Acinetobacter phage vB_AbaM_ME3]
MLGKCFKLKDSSLSHTFHIHSVDDVKGNIRLNYSQYKNNPSVLGNIAIGDVTILNNIHWIKGDITHTDKGVITHQVNTLGRSGSGVVVPIKKMYQGWEEEYLAFIEDNKDDLLGKVSFNSINSDLFIANIFSQFRISRIPSRNTCLSSLEQGLQQVKTLAKNAKIPVYVPYKLASDRGGMSWEDEVFPLLTSVFEDGLVDLYIVEYTP